MPSASVTSKGQITILRAIREQLKLSTGDRVDFVVDGENVILRAATADVRELRGLLRQPGRKPVSLEEMDAAIARHHSGPRTASDGTRSPARSTR
jgi:antitoxin PrlF